MMTIPEVISKDLYEGRAQYKTFQTGFGGQSVLSVPEGAQIVIFGYDYSPAGSGYAIVSENYNNAANTIASLPNGILPFLTQQITFYNGAELYPFVHHVPFILDRVRNLERMLVGVAAAPITRSAWINSNKDVAITVGLVFRNESPVQQSIDVTDTTPLGITYGGAAVAQNVHTRLSPAAAIPSVFVQPENNTGATADKYGTPPDVQGVGQVFFQPDQTDGLIEPTAYLETLQSGLSETTAANYFLCIHYALYLNQR